MIIAIDGSAASGKGTLAKRLAEHFAYARLDTGLLYRAVGLAVLRAGEDPYDPEAAGGAPTQTYQFVVTNLVGRADRRTWRSQTTRDARRRANPT